MRSVTFGYSKYSVWSVNTQPRQLSINRPALIQHGLIPVVIFLDDKKRGSQGRSLRRRGTCTRMVDGNVDGWDGMRWVYNTLPRLGSLDAALTHDPARYAPPRENRLRRAKSQEYLRTHALLKLVSRPPSRWRKVAL